MIRLFFAATLVMAACGAQAETTEAQARTYVWSALMTGAAHSIVANDVELAAPLRERLGLPEPAERDRIYEALVTLTRGRLLRVRAATREESAALAPPVDGRAFFVVEGGAAPLLLAYDLLRDQIPAIAVLGAPAVAVAKPAPPPAVPAKSFLLKPVYFAHGDATLSEEAVGRLQEAGLQKFVEVRGVHYVVRGHSDRVESAKLSQARAEAVRDYLVALGAAAADIRLMAFGSSVSMTACAQRDAAVLISCLGPDRRVTVEVVPQP